MTPRQGLLALFGFVSALLIVLQPPAVQAAPGDLQLVAQGFNVDADGSLTATLALPPTLANMDLTTASVVVTVFQRLNSHEEFARVVADWTEQPDTLPRPDDDRDDLARMLRRTAARSVHRRDPTGDLRSASRRTEHPSCRSLPGDDRVARDGTVLSSVLSFLNRLPAVDETVDTDPISVAIGIATHSTVHLDSKGTISLDDTTATEMTKLADVLDVLTTDKFPTTVRIEPAVLNGLQQLNPAVFARLITSLQLNQAVAEPLWPIDAAAAATANQDVLYTSWRRDGQELFADLGLGGSVVSTSTILVDQSLGAEGAALRRRDGARLMVMSPEIYDQLDGSILIYSDFTGELVPADLPNGVTLDVAVVDHTISQLLAHPLPTMEQTRIYTVANLLALRQKIATSGASLLRHAVVIGAPDLAVPDPQLLGSITTLIAETPGLAAATLDDVALRTDELLVNGEERPVTLPPGDPTKLQARIFTQAALNNEIDAVASMLPADSEKPKAWRDLTELLPTTALDALAATEMVATIRGELAEISEAVEWPVAYTVNLPGKRSTVRIRFVNNSDVPLKIKVRLSSPSGKLVFANDGEPIELEPGVPTGVPIG